MDHVLSRRAFAALGFGSLAALALTGRARGQTPAAPGQTADLFMGWKDIRPGVRIATEQGGNALLVQGPSGRSILVDCKNPGFGPTLRREAESFGSTLELVINTHHHRDHVGGNTSFTKDLPVVAHKNARERILNQVDQLVAATTRMVEDMATAKRPVTPQVRDEIKAFADWVTTITGDEFAPTRLVEKDEETISIAGLDIVLRHFGNGHTDNDLVVFIPSLNIVHTGDLLFRKLHPFIDRSAGASTRSWQQVVTKVADLCDDKTLVIPGHGEVCDKSALKDQSDYFDKAREVIRHAKNVEGMSKVEVGGLNPGAFGEFGFPQIRPRTFTAIYEEIEEEEAAAKAK
jgi:glyoxylase-like metal-dependent hydrolase (beta-lactamase superfamily II)